MEKEYLEFAKEIAAKAGEIMLKYFKCENGANYKKKNNSGRSAWDLIMENFDKEKFAKISELIMDEEAKKEQETKEENKEMFDLMAEALKGKVQSVKATTRLKTHPVCITSEGELSVEMEKVLNKMPTDNHVEAQKILEINIHHKTFDTLKSLYNTDKEKLKKYTGVLYAAAQLIEGLSVDDPVEFANSLCDLIG